MGNAIAALIYLGLGAGSSVLATTMRKDRQDNKRKYFIGNMLVGSTAAWLGGILFGPVGPAVYGISLVSTTVASVGAVLGYNWLSDRLDKRSEKPTEA